jgi:DNA-directed RNA polymerase specialized sigma24 family protein
MSETNMHSAEVAETSAKAMPDRRLYLKLVDRYHARVYDYLCWLCRDESLAEDLTAETFLRLWQHPPDATKRGSLKAYVFKAALNQYRQHLRSRGADLVGIEDTGASPIRRMSRLPPSSAARSDAASARLSRSSPKSIGPSCCSIAWKDSLSARSLRLWISR